MTTLGATLKLAAVEQVVERLLREASEHSARWCDDTKGFQVEARPLATELRGILDADVPTGATPLEAALSELAEWAMKHRKVDRALLAGAMLAEVIGLDRHDGMTWGDFVSVAHNLWNASEEEDQGDG